MRISGPTYLPPARLLGALTRTAATFDTPEETPAPAAASAPRPMTSVQMLVAIAAVESGPDRRRRMAADAEKGLGALERLHAALAAGQPAAPSLEDAARWLESFTAPDDPELAAILRDIELRVRVELAKHELNA